MKTVKILVHPVSLIICFLMIIISGQHLGGFYLLYLLLALPHGSIHALLGISGAILLLINHYWIKLSVNKYVFIFINAVGSFLLAMSLYVFFINDKEHYNYGTFSQTVPLITLALFGIVFISFFINNIWFLTHRMNSQGK
jgi:hypothetical protein